MYSSTRNLQGTPDSTSCAQWKQYNRSMEPAASAQFGLHIRFHGCASKALQMCRPSLAPTARQKGFNGFRNHIISRSTKAQKADKESDGRSKEVYGNACYTALHTATLTMKPATLNLNDICTALPPHLPSVPEGLATNRPGVANLEDLKRLTFGYP